MKSNRCHESEELNRLCGRMVKVTLWNDEVHCGTLRRTDNESSADRYFDGYSVGGFMFHKTHVLSVATLKYGDIASACEPSDAENVCECGQALAYKTTTDETNERRVCPACGRLHYIDTSPDFRRAFK